MKTFRTKLLLTDKGGAYVLIPDEIITELGISGRTKVKAIIQGIEYKGSVMKMGGEEYLLGILKSIRHSKGLNEGDLIEIKIEIDHSRREISLPEMLSRHFDLHPELFRIYSGLSYTNQKEIAEWIRSAVKPDTLRKRLSLLSSKMDSLPQKRS